MLLRLVPSCEQERVATRRSEDLLLLRLVPRCGQERVATRTLHRVTITTAPLPPSAHLLPGVRPRSATRRCEDLVLLRFVPRCEQERGGRSLVATTSRTGRPSRHRHGRAYFGCRASRACWRQQARGFRSSAPMAAWWGALTAAPLLLTAISEEDPLIGRSRGRSCFWRLTQVLLGVISRVTGSPHPAPPGPRRGSPWRRRESTASRRRGAQRYTSAGASAPPGR